MKTLVWLGVFIGTSLGGWLPTLAGADRGSRFQFERQGYFCVDARDSAPARLVFNRTVGLRDTWARIEKGAG